MGYQFQSIASVAPFLVANLAIDYAMLGTLIGLYKLPGVIFAIPGGALGRRFGDKQIVTAGLILMALGGVLVGVSESYAMALVGRTLSGCGGVLLNILLAKMTLDWFADKEVVLAMAILVNSWPFGIAIGLVTQSALAAAFGWQVVLFSTTAVAGASLLLIVVGYRPPPDAAQANGGQTRWFSLSRQEFGGVTVAAGAWTLYNVGLILVVSFGPTFVTARGLSIQDAAWLVSLGTWLGIATVPLGGYLAQRWNRPNTVMVACLTAAAVTCAAMPASESLMLPFLVFGLLAWAPAGPIMALVSQTLRPANRAVGMGVFFTWYYAGMGVLPPLAGAARDLTESPDVPIYFAGAMMLASLGCAGLFRLSRRTPAIALG